MISSKPGHYRIHGILVLILFLGLAFNFNNCGRTPSVEGSDLPNRSLEAKVASLKTIHQGQLPVGFCDQSSNYECLHKIFSKSIQDEEWPEGTQCLNGAQFCSAIRTRAYNSSVLAKDCPSCETDYDEFECHVKLPDSTGLYPLVLTNRSFDQAVNQLRALCDSVSGGR